MMSGISENMGLVGNVLSLFRKAMFVGGRILGLYFAILFVCFLFFYLSNVFVYNETIFHWRHSFFFAALYSVICSIIYFVYFVFSKSPWALFFVSWFVTLFMFFHGKSNALEGHMTVREAGVEIYVNGEMTFLGGMMRLFFDPVTFMAIGATIYLVKGFFVNKKIIHE